MYSRTRVGWLLLARITMVIPQQGLKAILRMQQDKVVAKEAGLLPAQRVNRELRVVGRMPIVIRELRVEGHIPICHSNDCDAILCTSTALLVIIGSHCMEPHCRDSPDGYLNVVHPMELLPTTLYGMRLCRGCY